MKNVISQRLENKKQELEKLKYHFDTFYNNEKNSSNFEKNAISQLLIMQKLKSEIAELEFLNQLSRFQK